MAEIKVEPKRSALGWLWAIIILALLAAGFWYFMHTSTAVQSLPADSTKTSLVSPSAPRAEGSING